MCNVVAYLLGICGNDNELAEKCIIYSYLKNKCIKYSDNSIIGKYLNGFTISNLLEPYDNSISLKTINDLLFIMEQLVSVEDKKINGVVYTPYEVKKYMINEINIEKISDKLYICDPACGCGSFLVSVAEYLHSTFKIKYKDIFNTYIYGVDILNHNIVKAKVLLSILALENGEEYDGEFNLITSNSLELNWELTFPTVFLHGGFDYVIGNPPYVSLKNMSDDVRMSLNSWMSSKCGNTDLYIVFYELALNIVNKKGTVAFITVNTFFSSLNARELRKIIANSNINMFIYNFNDKQLFDNIQSYNCISIMKKKNNGDSTITKFNAEVNDKGCLKSDKRKKVKITLKDTTSSEPWILLNKTQLNNLNKLQRFTRKLSDYLIRNGVATLKNDIYFFSPYEEDRNFFYLQKDGQKFKIEKMICRNIVKPNILKNEDDLVRLMEKAIFPYKIVDGNAVCYNENEMKEKFPMTLEYFYAKKSELDNRDKGHGNYEEWYAYGRKQGLYSKGIKLFLPYIAERPVAVLAKDEDLLYYCGNAIFVNNEHEGMFLKRIVESSVFAYYIRLISKPYANGFYSLSKAYIKDFSIPQFDEEEFNNFVLTTQENANRILIEKYKFKI